MADLLLHSLAEFAEIIERVLDATEARTTVEIGVEHGPLSAALIARAERLHGRHVGIDPAPEPRARAPFEAAEAELLVRRSADALEILPAMDAYFIDGDHNYATVSAELALVGRAADRAGRPFPLVFAHDIGWPWGRRDLYYDPAALPADAVHPHSFSRGVVLDNPDTVNGGFRGEGRFACALREGGPRNGVRTAIEAVVAERDLGFFEIPSVFGLGILYDKAAERRLAPCLDPYHRNPLLARLERNRLQLYLRVLSLQDELNAHRAMLNAVAVRAAAAAGKAPA